MNDFFEKVKKGRKVYDDIIKKQVYDAKTIVSTYKDLMGIDEQATVNVRKARIYLFNLYYRNDDQTIYEMLSGNPIKEKEETSSINQEEIQEPSEINKLTAAEDACLVLEDELENEEDKTKRTVLKRKITMLKKEIEEMKQ